MSNIEQLLENNASWAAKIKQENPDFFKQLSKGQEPNILWIGCSDSRVPANQVAGLQPGELFVHRNIANVVVHTDLNCLSVVQYAVEVLEVDHIVICGHYGCGGVKAAMGEQNNGLIDNWLRHIKDVARLNADELQILTENKKYNRLCELNVKEQVINISSTTIVQQAWEQGADLTVHGLIYDLETGKLKDLDLSVASLQNMEEIY